MQNFLNHPHTCSLWCLQTQYLTSLNQSSVQYPYTISTLYSLQCEVKHPWAKYFGKPLAGNTAQWESTWLNIQEGLGLAGITDMCHRTQQLKIFSLTGKYVHCKTFSKNVRSSSSLTSEQWRIFSAKYSQKMPKLNSHS